MLVCNDINECLIGSGTTPSIDDNTINTSPLECHADADCINTVGTYQCRCKVGFGDSADRVLTGTIGVSDEIREEWLGEEPDNKFSTGIDCVDVNECSTKQHACHFYASCINNHGSYTCECFNGYQDMNVDNFPDYVNGTNCVV